MTNNNDSYGEKHLEFHVSEMTDMQLIDLMVDQNIRIIQAQRKYVHNPLALSVYTPKQKKYYDAAWAECIKRDIHQEINERVLIWMNKNDKARN